MKLFAKNIPSVAFYSLFHYPQTDNFLPTMRITILFFLTLFSVQMGLAQQASSKSKTKNKIYEKEAGQQVELKNAEIINSERLEFSPVFYQNGIVYVTSRYKAGAIDKKIGQTFFELFYAELDTEGSPMKPQEFSVNMNSQVHEGPVSFNKKGNKIYFTRNNMEKGVSKADSKGISRLKIYEAKKGKFDWEEVREMPFNEDSYSTCHPSISDLGNQIYFSSDMPGGYGGFDLYVVSKDGGRWTAPLNLGPEINTEKNELFPFIHESGTLFFSSNGHPGMGELDIYSVELNGASTGPIINLGAPFNSEKDDLGFIIDEDGERGFFASSREGGLGEDDIYQFKSNRSLSTTADLPMVNAQILVVDKATNLPISDAGVRIMERASDGMLEGDDLYDIELMPVDNNSGELVMKLKRKDARELGEASKFTNTKGEIVTQMQPNKQYLILVTKDGFENGEKLFSPNNSGQILTIPLSAKNGVTLLGQVLNNGKAVRNAVIRIQNESDGTEQRVRADAEGKFKVNLPEGTRYTVYNMTEGYVQNTQKISTEGRSASQDMILNFNVEPTTANSMVKEPLRRGSVILLENIYYDFNKSAIRSGAARELDALVNLMLQYPTMEIDLVAHTDSQGSAEYNMDLSIRRAKSAKQYLVSKGVASKRVRAFGYGETQPRNQCVDGVKCSDDEHQYNRRTEVKVTKIEQDIKVQYRN